MRRRSRRQRHVKGAGRELGGKVSEHMHHFGMQYTRNMSDAKRAIECLQNVRNAQLYCHSKGWEGPGGREGCQADAGRS
jgi:hypothetical protein